MRQETLRYGSQGGNPIGMTYPDRGEQAIQQGDFETSEAWFSRAADHWKQAILLAPGNYIEARNWLKITGRLKDQ